MHQKTLSESKNTTLGVGETITCLIQTEYPEHMKNSYNSTTTVKTQLKNEQSNSKKKKNMGKGLNKHISKKNHTNGHRHMRRCSISLIIREMQIKTTTTISMYIINKT